MKVTKALVQSYMSTDNMHVQLVMVFYDLYETIMHDG